MKSKDEIFDSMFGSAQDDSKPVTGVAVRLLTPEEIDEVAGGADLPDTGYCQTIGGGGYTQSGGGTYTQSGGTYSQSGGSYYMTCP